LLQPEIVRKGRKATLKYMKRYKILFACIMMLYAIFSSGYSQQNRALLIGVGTYNPNPEVVKVIQDEQSIAPNRNWGNLDGCVNDVRAFGEVLKARFGFDESDMEFLTDSAATRDNIVAEFERLITESNPGDIVVIFFAGHGSHVFNSQTAEADQRDESIVPADSYLGVKDIRDKELSSYLNRILDKGAILTAIFDCCHSGSNSRGSYAKTRHIEWDPRDAADPSVQPSPSSRGALVIASAQDFELAQEDRDENGNPHGAFTLAFLKALNSLPANVAAIQVFESTQTYMRANGKRQVPVIDATEGRKNQTLLGLNPSSHGGKTMVSVLGKNPSGIIDMQGGYALGLGIGSELEKVSAESDTIRLRIIEVGGLTQSRAKVVKGDIKEVSTGTPFQVVLWANSSEPNLKVWVPSTSFTDKEIKEFGSEIDKLKESKLISLLDDGSEVTPDIEIFYSSGDWYLRSKEKAIKPIPVFKAENIVELAGTDTPKVYIHIPPTGDLAARINESFTTNNTALAVVEKIEQAHYLLSGRFVGKDLQYAWVLPDVSKDEKNFESPLPYRTNWLPFSNEKSEETTNSLIDYAIRLGKIRAWLTLKSPPDLKGFPYKLRIKDLATNEVVTDNKMYGGKSYRLFLHATDDAMKSWSGERQFVYVITIDNLGKTQVIFPPQSLGSVENFLPIQRSGGYQLEVPLSGSFNIVPPFGTDTFILLTTSEALPNPHVLASEGVLTRGGEDSDNLLMNLLSNVGASSRSRSPATPASWTITQTTIVSIEK
jgi:hypothetical protein